MLWNKREIVRHSWFPVPEGTDWFGCRRRLRRCTLCRLAFAVRITPTPNSRLPAHLPPFQAVNQQVPSVNKARLIVGFAFSWINHMEVCRAPMFGSFSLSFLLVLASFPSILICTLPQINWWSWGTKRCRNVLLKILGSWLLPNTGVGNQAL